MASPINPAAAASAYANTAQGKAFGGIAEESKGASFGDILKQTAGDTIRAMRASETASAQAITGEASLTDVVQAVTSAELTLQTLVAVRDRLIGAYQEIMRMPI